MEEILYHPIGLISTPFKEAKNILIQGCFDDEAEGCCILFDEYAKGVNDLDGFSHAIILYHFHKAKDFKLIAKPFLEKVEHGIFSIRSPRRPNKIGFSIVKIKKIIDNKLFFTHVDMLDGTPLLDIKPYVKHFDHRENVKSGWVDRHFEGGNTPKETILK